ncbi:zinc finger, C2H2 type [Necator americanus]|uniref:Zinc finger, C2H2 type n=1 Tax=Necator americanus TaxID=51031 RepID=W2TUN7_NECAM|nr:zinc finger, C2H2 type [Necator americanus]ETN85810.1 zinc finger, C2H2 type [Necator americanus]
MASMSYVVDVYPTEEEIVRNEGELICQLCGKRFSNISARRLHAVKTHRILSCESDRRIYEKVRDGRPRRYIYHCPVEPCRKKTLRFDGMRNLKQHYIRPRVQGVCKVLWQKSKQNRLKKDRCRRKLLGPPVGCMGSTKAGKVHTRKTILCKCGSAFALRKDLLYHEKKRCLLRDRPKKPTKQIGYVVSLRPAEIAFKYANDEIDIMYHEYPTRLFLEKEKSWRQD